MCGGTAGRRPPGLGRTMVFSVSEGSAKGSSRVMASLLKGAASADRPQLHFKVGEVAGDMHGEAAGARHLLPVGAVAVEFEIDHAGVVGHLARGHRQGPQPDPRQGRVDQLPDLFDRAHLGLGREMTAHALGWHRGLGGKHEIGRAEQPLVRDHRHRDAVLAWLDGDRHGVLLEHRAEILAQGAEHRLEHVGQVVMGVGRKLRRALFRRHQCRQLSGKRGEALEDRLRVGVAQGHQVADLRQGAVHAHQQQEIRDLGHALGRAGLVQTPRQRLGAVAQKALELTQEIVQRAGGAGIQRRGDEGPVEHHLAVGAHLDDARHRDHQLVRQVVEIERQSHAQLAHRHLHRAGIAAHAVGDLDLLGSIARRRLRRAAQVDLRGAMPARRDREVDHRVLGALRHVERRRLGIGLGHPEGGAIGGEARAGFHRQLAELEQLLVERQLGHAPAIGGERSCHPGDQRFDIAVVLLEVMGLEEHPLLPDDLVIPGHGGDPSLCFVGRDQRIETVLAPTVMVTALGLSGISARLARKRLPSMSRNAATTPMAPGACAKLRLSPTLRPGTSWKSSTATRSEPSVASGSLNSAKKSPERKLASEAR
ncbi:hypothetical protein R2601_16025 [Salipiger bermudensis HTCC2601]|uniref:Uncharacterized protein n=1 Tax=Salipiger bermudensis (strain DSM 26914 / JCM 13377 / KCTC 12554 / HTCC2601) TaxID=314265 RepID=Q0FRE3_SALBH|nr:hypothetical protein R2601_16025 [Salipiger bermudensis HTCC2601]